MVEQSPPPEEEGAAESTCDELTAVPIPYHWNGSSLYIDRASLGLEHGSACTLQGLLDPPAGWAPLPTLAAG